MKFRGHKLYLGLANFWLLLGLAAGSTAGMEGCSNGLALPDFPEYPPTVPFLEEQADRKRRAEAIAEYNRREQLKYGVKFHEENLAAWLPIYNRGQFARETKSQREQGRREAMARFQEQTTARWLPVQKRIFDSRTSRPGREAADQTLRRQYQEKTTGEWLPHQKRIFEHVAGRGQREFDELVKKRSEAKFPSGTRLPSARGTIRRAR